MAMLLQHSHGFVEISITFVINNYFFIETVTFDRLVIYTLVHLISLIFSTVNETVTYDRLTIYTLVYLISLISSTVNVMIVVCY